WPSRAGWRDVGADPAAGALCPVERDPTQRPCTGSLHGVGTVRAGVLWLSDSHVFRTRANLDSTRVPRPVVPVPGGFDGRRDLAPMGFGRPCPSDGRLAFALPAGRLRGDSGRDSASAGRGAAA